MHLVPASIRKRIEQRPGLARIVENIGWLTVDKLLRMALGVVVSVWIARHLGPDDFGVISYAIAFVAVFGIIATFGLEQIVVRDLVRDPRGRQLTLGTAFALHLAGGVAAFCLAVIAVSLARQDDTVVRIAVTILGSALIFKATEVATYWFESQVQSKYVVWMQSAVFIVFAVIKIVLILNNASVVQFVWAMCAEIVVAGLAVIVVFSWKGPGVKGVRIQCSRATTLLRDSWPLALAGISVMLYMRIDQIMLGQMIGNEAVGLYSAAVRVSEVWYFIPGAIVASVFPAIIEAKRKSETLYYDRLQKLYDLMVLLSLGIALPMTFLSDWLVHALFGDAYQGAGTILAVHVWASVFVFLGVASGKWFVVENRQMLSLQRAVAGAVLNVALNLAVIPRFGGLGAAWATVIAYSLAGLFFDVVQAPTRQMYRMKLRSLNPVSAFMRIASAAR